MNGFVLGRISSGMYVAGGTTGKLPQSRGGIDGHVLPVAVAVDDIKVVELLLLGPIAEVVSGMRKDLVGVIVIFSFAPVRSHNRGRADQHLEIPLITPIFQGNRKL